MWGTLSAFLPKSSIDKIAVCPAGTATTLSTCPGFAKCFCLFLPDMSEDMSEKYSLSLFSFTKLKRDREKNKSTLHRDFAKTKFSKVSALVQILCTRPLTFENFFCGTTLSTCPDASSCPFIRRWYLTLKPKP